MVNIYKFNYMKNLNDQIERMNRLFDYKVGIVITEQMGDIIIIHPNANDNAIKLNTDMSPPEGKHCVYRLEWKLNNETKIKFFKLIYSVLGENQVVTKTFEHEVEVDDSEKQLLFKNKWKGDGVSYQAPFDGEGYYDWVYLKPDGNSFYNVEIEGYNDKGQVVAKTSKIIYAQTSGNDACVDEK